MFFLVKHSADAHKSDEFSRWWPEWHKYHKDPSTGQIIYDHRVQIRPDRTPSPHTHIQWATLLPLHGPDSIALLGPFDFQSCNETNQLRRKLSQNILSKLSSICASNGLHPPSLGSLPPSRPMPKRYKRKR